MCSLLLKEKGRKKGLRSPNPADGWKCQEKLGKSSPTFCAIVTSELCIVGLFPSFFFGMISYELAWNYCCVMASRAEVGIKLQAWLAHVLKCCCWARPGALELCSRTCSSRVIFYERICIWHARAGLRLSSCHPR